MNNLLELLAQVLARQAQRKAAEVKNKEGQSDG
jgi:hypothetical protein